MNRSVRIASPRISWGWFELRIGDNSRLFAPGPCDFAAESQGLDWISPSDPQLKVLKTTTENLDVVVDLRFPTQSIRYLNLRPFPLRTWEIAEFEVYGEGFVEETTYLTQILDFGQPINWGKIRWSAHVPEGTRIEIRTRTGHTPNPNLYFAENTNGDLDQIELKDYLKIDVGARLAPVYDTAHWSFWSTPYEFAAGPAQRGSCGNGVDGWNRPFVAKSQPVYPARHQALFDVYGGPHAWIR